MSGAPQPGGSCGGGRGGGAPAASSPQQQQHVGPRPGAAGEGRAGTVQRQTDPAAPRFGSAGSKGPPASGAPPPGDAALRPRGWCGFLRRVPGDGTGTAFVGTAGRGADRERVPAQLGPAASEFRTLLAPGAAVPSSQGTPAQHLPRAAPNMADRHPPPRELRAPACTAPRRTACREPERRTPAKGRALGGRVCALP